jgi:methionine sulfoxide reductase heme-binding subunit
MGILLKNTATALLGALLSYGFWLTRPEWDPEMRLWRAVGDAGLILLFLALVLGPLAKLWPQALRLLPYRRELGVWFGLFAFLHTLLVLNGWARWDALRFLGYEFVPQLGRVARLEPGFGLSNLLGLVAMLFTLVLMATSTDWAVRRLGGKAWKFLQLSSYIVFYLSALHTAYFVFMHYTMSFHRQVPADPNWFRWPFLALTLGVIALQVSAYLKGVVSRRTPAPRGEPGNPPGVLR